MPDWISLPCANCPFPFNHPIHEDGEEDAHPYDPGNDDITSILTGMDFSSLEREVLY